MRATKSIWRNTIPRWRIYKSSWISMACEYSREIEISQRSFDKRSLRSLFGQSIDRVRKLNKIFIVIILKEKKFVNIICSVTAAEVKVSLGEYDLCNLDVSSSTISVESLILYPEYNIESHAHNLALIKLSQTVKFERRLSPICLPNPGMYFTYLIFIINFFCFILLFFK